MGRGASSQKTQASQEIEKGRFYLQQVKEKTRDISQSSVSKTTKLGSFNQGMHTNSWRGFCNGEWTGAKVIFRWQGPGRSPRASRGQQHQLSWVDLVCLRFKESSVLQRWLLKSALNSLYFGIGMGRFSSLIGLGDLLVWERVSYILLFPLNCGLLRPIPRQFLHISGTSGRNVFWAGSVGQA